MFLTYRWRNFDWVLLGGLLVLTFASLVILSSSAPDLFKRQAVWYFLAFLIIIFGSHLNWRWIISHRWFFLGFYWFTIILLLITHLQTKTIRGTKSWLVFNGFQIEPAELAKLALILVLAAFFSKKYISAWRSKNILISFFYALIPCSLIALHPDLGSAAVILGLWIAFLFMSGINKKRLLLGVIIMILAFILLWSFFLKPYQKDRIIGFIFPQYDPLGINYNIIQSKIAIGSAGFFGKGFGGGTQTQLKFLPAAQTDFLFAAFTEEWGILGGLVLLLTFILIISRLIRIGITARDNHSRFVVLGGGVFLIIHFFINVGSNLGLVPVTGLTFPFFSYGGTNLLTTAVILSIIEHIKLESR